MCPERKINPSRDASWSWTDFTEPWTSTENFTEERSLTTIRTYWQSHMAVSHFQALLAAQRSNVKEQQPARPKNWQHKSWCVRGMLCWDALTRYVDETHSRSETRNCYVQTVMVACVQRLPVFRNCLQDGFPSLCHSVFSPRHSGKLHDP